MQGLGGVMPFTIAIIPGSDKVMKCCHFEGCGSVAFFLFFLQVPQAATCFNTLKLTGYSSEQQFRNKMLIAIRYGCEGFEFS